MQCENSRTTLTGLFSTDRSIAAGLPAAMLFYLKPVFPDGTAKAASRFFCRARQNFSEIIGLFQENLTRYGRKSAVDTVFLAGNTGSRNHAP